MCREFSFLSFLYTGSRDEAAIRTSKYVGEPPALMTKFSGSQKHISFDKLILSAAIYYPGATNKQVVLKRRFRVGRRGERSHGVCLTVGIGQLLFKILKGIGAVKVDYCACNVDNGALLSLIIN